MQTPEQLTQWRKEAQKLWNEQGRAHWVNISDFNNYAAGYLRARTDQANEQYIKANRSITLVKDRELDVKPVPSLIEQPLITAEKARKLGVGKAECFTLIFGWKIIGYQHIYRDENKYRAIKQPEPVEPQTKALEEAIAICNDALHFYAEPSNYKSPSQGFAAQYNPEPSLIQNDAGKRARDVIGVSREFR